MASALETLVNGYNTEQPVSFYDFYNAYGQDHSAGKGKWNERDPYSLGAKFQNFLFGTTNSADKEYQNYLASWEDKKNEKKIAATNAESYAREDSQIPRLMQQYEQAGLNPYLLLNNGNISGGVASSQAQYQPYKRSSSTKKDESKLASSALKILAIIALKSMM